MMGIDIYCYQFRSWWHCWWQITKISKEGKWLDKVFQVNLAKT